MPDLFTEDQTREAFARFRADELPRVAGPGSAAVHRTVRRRRVVRGAATAGLAVALLAGGIAAANALRDATAAPPFAGPSADPGPTLSAAELDALGETARASLANPPEPAGGSPMGGWGGIDGLGWHYDHGPATGVEPGVYDVSIACVGTGFITVEFGAGTAASTVMVNCGPRPEPIAANVDVSSRRQISVRILGAGPDTLGRSGYAYSIVPR